MAETAEVVTKRRGTSWISVIGGWIASVGMTALLAPLAAGVVAARGGLPDDISLAVPAILAVMLAYLVGGYVAGRMAGYATSWHGLMTAFFGLFVVLVAILVGVAADRGYLGDVRIGALDSTYAWGFGPTTVGDALTFGAIIGFLATIFAGWLGGLLAPTRPFVRRVPAVPGAAVPHAEETTVPAAATVVREPAPRRSFRLLPGFGRKGGERVERVEPETRQEGEDRAVVERRIEEHRR